MGTNPKNLLLIIVLQRSEYLAEAWEAYYKAGQDTDNSPMLNIVRARLITLYERVRPGLVKSVTPEEAQEFEAWIYSENEKDLLKIYRIVEDYLHDINVTKIATRQVYDRTNTEEENRMKGL